jgi:hypothetical protein
MKKRNTGTSGTERTATRSDRTKRSMSGRVVNVLPAFGSTWTVGMDLGDRTSHFCVLDEGGMVVERGEVQTTREGFRKRFEGQTRMRIALEVGTHSPWVSRLLKELGHEVLVPNPRKTRLIYENRGKQDPVDAEALARIARLDPKLLYPVEHRRESVAQDLAVLRARDALVSSVRPTRGKADNSTGSKKPLHNDWFPVCGFHHGPEPTLAPTKKAVDTCAVATPAHHHHPRSKAASTSTTETLCFPRRRKLETARI